MPMRIKTAITIPSKPVFPFFGKFKESGAINNVELKIQTKDGNELAVSWTGRIGHNLDGSFRQTYCILADIDFILRFP